MGFKGPLQFQPFCDSISMYPGGAGRSQKASAELAYLVSVSIWGKSQPSCPMSGLSWKRELHTCPLEPVSSWGLQEL